MGGAVGQTTLETPKPNKSHKDAAWERSLADETETPGKTGGGRGQVKVYLGRLPAVYLVPRAQLTVAVISLHENPSKFINQTQVVVTQGAAEHLRREAAG